jgi:hypothetical protein
MSKLSKMTNHAGIHLVPAMWLATDSYDFNIDPEFLTKNLSATTLLRSDKQIVLGIRHAELVTSDVLDRYAVNLGTAIHDSFEKMFLSGGYKRALMILGYTEAQSEMFMVNPEGGAEIVAEKSPIYLEKRTEKFMNGVKISGKFDLVLHSFVHDFKSATVYSVKKGSNRNKHGIQGSIYRWLNPEIIKGDTIYIHHIIKDWSAGRVGTEPGYPTTPIVTEAISLMSLEETEEFIKLKVGNMQANLKRSQDKLLPCTPDELWQDDPKYKYYKDPNKKTRATRVFDTMAEAMALFDKQGSVGVIDTVFGSAKACNYCSAFEFCEQGKALHA